jgi:methylmalonyl-CoA/ethylmalonyl-CoA epimerase
VPADRIEGAKLDHLAFGAYRIADGVDLLVGRLGGRAHHGGPGPGFRGAQWEFADGGRIEIIEPDGPEGGFMHRFLAARGPGIHHVTFKVPDIYRARDVARAHGYDVVGFNDAFEGWKEMFLHPGQAQGIVVQMAQTSPTIPDDSWSPDFAFPRYEGTVPKPARLIGVRLSSRSLERARAQWEGLMGGKCTTENGSLVFRWSESPLRICVEEDATRAEGPLQMEIANNDGIPHDVIDPTLKVRIVSLPFS